MPYHKFQTSLHRTLPTNLLHQIFNCKLSAQLESHFYPYVKISKFHPSLHSFMSTATTLHAHLGSMGLCGAETGNDYIFLN